MATPIKDPTVTLGFTAAAIGLAVVCAALMLSSGVSPAEGASDVITAYQYASPAVAEDIIRP